MPMQHVRRLNVLVGLSAMVVAAAAFVPHKDEPGPVLKAAASFVGAKDASGSAIAASAPGPVRMLTSAALAALNGIVAPPLIVILLLICNNAEIIGKRTNKPISNVLGWITVAFMGAAAGFLMWAISTGKAS